MEVMRDVLKTAMRGTLRALEDKDKLTASWLVACGRTLAEHGTITGYADGNVRVEVQAGAWFEQLKSMRADLAAELERIAGVPVTGIHFVVKR